MQDIPFSYTSTVREALSNESRGFNLNIYAIVSYPTNQY
jgi:hypothetical protein